MLYSDMIALSLCVGHRAPHSLPERARIRAHKDSIEEYKALTHKALYNLTISLIEGMYSTIEGHSKKRKGNS